MDTSYLLAQLFGSYMVLMGVAMFMRPAMLDDIVSGFERNKALMMVTGAFVFMGGFLAVSFHNVWEASWRVVVTLSAWATLLKGVQYLLCPDWMMSKARWAAGSGAMRKGAPFLVILIGLYLLYVGFGVSFFG